MRKQKKALQLNRETISRLDDKAIESVAGGCFLMATWLTCCCTIIDQAAAGDQDQANGFEGTQNRR